MSKQIRIGVLYTKIGKLDETMHRCLQWGYPQIISPGQKAGVDVVIIPDGVGAYPGMLCFAGNPASAAFRALNTPMCPLAELFRIGSRGICYYQGERGIPIIGIGDGRIMLWDQINQKVGVGTDKYHLLPGENMPLLNRSLNASGTVLEFSTENGLHGVSDLQSLTLTQIMMSITKEVFDTTIITQDKEWANPSQNDNSDIE